jgi:hypothetical protein
MDPNATWAALLRAYREADAVACCQLCRELLAWLTQGGFPPKITGIDELDRSMARAVCAEHLYWDPEGEADHED